MFAHILSQKVKKTKRFVHRYHFMFAHIRAYAIRPYTNSVEIRASLGKNTITNRPIQSSYYHRINGKYVGAYCIRPPRQRAWSLKRWCFVRCHHFMFAHMKGVCNTPLRLSANNQLTWRPHGGEHAHYTMIFYLPLLFSSSPTWRAYALAPLRFSCDAETTVFSHHSLRNCFTIKDEVANGEPSSAGRQGCFRDWKAWF